MFLFVLLLLLLHFGWVTMLLRWLGARRRVWSGESHQGLATSFAQAHSPPGAVPAVSLSALNHPALHTSVHQAKDDDLAAKIDHCPLKHKGHDRGGSPVVVVRIHLPSWALCQDAVHSSPLHSSTQYNTHKHTFNQGAKRTKAKELERLVPSQLQEDAL